MIKRRRPNLERRTNPIWKLDEHHFRDLVAKHDSYADMLAELGLPNRGWHPITLRKRAIELSLDLNHIVPYRSKANSAAVVARCRTADEMFVENSFVTRGVVKRAILREKLIPYVCSECDQVPEWRGKPLTLVLDHINGKNRDHRLVNLRFLCPNCNSQTETFTGRNCRRH